MATNILTGLVPTLYAAMDKVSREAAGMIPAVTIYADSSRIALGQTLRIPITPSKSVETGTTTQPTKPSEQGETVGYADLTMDHWARGTFLVNSEEIPALGTSANAILQDQMAQAIRSVINQMEKDIAAEVVKSAALYGNFVGTAGTTPFASDLKSLILARKKLVDNGAPDLERNFVMNTEAGVNMRSLSQLQKVSEAGNEDLLRRGILGRLMGFDLRESAGLVAQTIAGSGYTINGAVTAGSTVKSVTVDGGSGAIAAGTIITFGDATEQYVVAEDVATGGTTIKLTTAITKNIADNAAVNLKTNTPCVGFNKSAVLLASKVPFIPVGGNEAKDITYVTDPVTGITLEVAAWASNYNTMYTVTGYYGIKTIKPEHTVCVLG